MQKTQINHLEVIFATRIEGRNKLNTSLASRNYGLGNCGIISIFAFLGKDYSNRFPP